MVTIGFMADYRRTVLNDLASGDGVRQDARAAQAREALQRLDDGSYGYCVRCGLKMPESRLERWPERAHCVACDDG